MSLEWKILGSKQIFSAASRFSVSVETVQLPNGRIIEDYYQIHVPECVVIFAETQCGFVLILEQYKHAARVVSYTFPGGCIGQQEDPIVAARRELLEETGYQSDDWVNLGAYVVNGNQGCGKAHFFMARNAKKKQEADSGDLEDMEILLIERAHLEQALHEGEFKLLNHVALGHMALSQRL